MKRILLLLLYLQPALALAAPRVVTSIAPLQEIAGALMAGIAEPQVIIENQASAHHFAFKPSHPLCLQTLAHAATAAGRPGGLDR
jgi:zinc transport system substrate-binding protein